MNILKEVGAGQLSGFALPRRDAGVDAKFSGLHFLKRIECGECWAEEVGLGKKFALMGIGKEAWSVNDPSGDGFLKPHEIDGLNEVVNEEKPATFEFVISKKKCGA